MKTIKLQISDNLHRELSLAAKAAGKLRPAFFLEMIIAGLQYTKYVNEQSHAK